MEIKNRKGQNIVGMLSKPEIRIVGTAILQHGYGGVKEHVQILAIQQALLNNGFQVLNFDSTNSFGESDGEYKHARLGLHADDFEDVANWATKQSWFTGKFLVAGHSMGGFAAMRYALRNNIEVNFVIPFAPVISGELIWAAQKTHNYSEFERWKNERIIFQDSKSLPGKEKEKPFEVMEEYLLNSLFKENSNNPPTLLISCELDTSIPPHYIRILYDSLQRDKTFKILKGARHTPRDPDCLEKLRSIIDGWLKKKLTAS